MRKVPGLAMCEAGLADSSTDGDTMPSMDSTSVFPQRLREALADYSRREVLEAIQSSPRALTGWLNGSCEPLASTLGRIAWALDVSSDWLLGLTDDRRAA